MSLVERKEKKLPRLPPRMSFAGFGTPSSAEDDEREAREGASSLEIVDMIRRGRAAIQSSQSSVKKAARRRRSTGGVLLGHDSTPSIGSTSMSHRPVLRRQKTSIGQQSGDGWGRKAMEIDRSSGASFHGHGHPFAESPVDAEEEDKSPIRRGAAAAAEMESVAAVEDDPTGFGNFDDDDGSSSDSSLDIHTPLVRPFLFLSFLSSFSSNLAYVR